MTETLHPITIKDWDDEDKPREKLAARGKKTLSNAELLAILIRSGVRGHSALAVAQEILNRVDNNLAELSRKSVDDIVTEHKGIGSAKAITIVAALELGYRMIHDEQRSTEHYITSSEDLYRYIGPHIIDLPQEEFWIIYLNIRNKVIYKKQVSVGGITQTLVDPRVVYKTALEKNAVSIALAHNHPAGSLVPSRQDISLTTKLIEAGKLLDINVIDHIIVGMDGNRKPGYYSFHDQGRM